MEENIIKDKSQNFAQKIVELSQKIIAEQNESVLSKQLLSSGKLIVALFREVGHGQSRAYFASKMNIAMKKTNETDYCLSLLKDSGYISPEWYESVSKDAKELVNLMANSVETNNLENS